MFLFIKLSYKTFYLTIFNSKKKLKLIYLRNRKTYRYHFTDLGIY